MIGTQWVGYSSASDPKSTDRMDHVALATDNIVAMRKYLIAQGIKAPQIQGRADHSLYFVVNDPEGHPIEFVERGKVDAAQPESSAISRHMIHAGFLFTTARPKTTLSRHPRLPPLLARRHERR